MAGKMSKKGSPKDSFTPKPPTSNTAPRGKSWRAGVPSRGKVGQITSGGGSRNMPDSAVQTGSCANMGDQCPANGHNVPRGFYAGQNVTKGILAGGGSTPLAHTGTKKGKVNPAAQVTGNVGW